MKKISFLLLLNVVTASLCLAQKPQSVLWEISGNGLKQKSYLFGTMHTAPREILNKFPILNEVMSKASAGVFESVRGESTTPTTEPPHEPPLDSLFSPSDYAIVDTFFVNHGYGSLKDHNNDASIGAMLQVAKMVKERKDDSSPDILDAYLEEPFFKNNKPSYALDDPKMVAEHKEALLGSAKSQADFLVAIIKGEYSTSAVDKTMHKDLYISSLKNYTYENRHYPTGEAYDVLGKKVTERNLYWLPKIENLIAKQSCFIAVGFGHLQYNTGLIAVLKKRGYTLKPINYNDKL